MRFGSLFAGIGGIDLGLERAGMTCVWQVEIDDYCRRVLAKHWPDVQRFEDVRKCGKRNLEPVDLIAGGFPCQDISDAGKRAGIDGERSGLWSEFARIIRELRPRYVLVENVAALLGRGMDRVLGGLASCGYDAEWECIPAAAVGAPHIRDRVFVVAHAEYATFKSASRVADSESVGKELRTTEGRRAGRFASGGSSVSDSSGKRLLPWCGYAGPSEWDDLIGFRETSGRVQWAVEPDVGRVANGVPRRVDRLRGLGNAVVPQVAEYIGRCIVSNNKEKLE